MAGRDIDGMGEMLEGVFRKQSGLKEFLAVLLERVMASEVDEHLGVQRHERSELRQGYRNGSKPRKLQTRVGEGCIRRSVAIRGLSETRP